MAETLDGLLAASYEQELVGARGGSDISEGLMTPPLTVQLCPLTVPTTLSEGGAGRGQGLNPIYDGAGTLSGKADTWGLTHAGGCTRGPHMGDLIGRPCA